MRDMKSTNMSNAFFHRGIPHPFLYQINGQFFFRNGGGSEEIYKILY